jgi:glyoxylase-like metal-dependent hydrolase (beta-lactamase superfamily II)
MTRSIFLLLCAWLLGSVVPGCRTTAADLKTASSAFRSFAPEGFSDLFSWTDTCNVYVLRDGESALLIDLGNGSVLDHLADIGVKQVDWVLFTHHHREQCQGFPKLSNWRPKIGGPEAERSLFERPSSFRKIRPRLNDQYTVHSASYVRPPIQPIHLDRAFARMDEFEWHGHNFRCQETKGNSPGSITYFLQEQGRWFAFSGDVMCDGARMHNYFDTEWDYSFGSGIYALHDAAAWVASYDPHLLLPSHGPAIRDGKKQLEQYQQKLESLEQMVLRGYSFNRFAGSDQDRVSKPTAVPNIWQVSPHLFKFKAQNFWPNFHMLLADSGHALVVDCGLFNEAYLDRALQGMREKLGLKAIDAVIITHMHGDHMLQVPYLQKQWGAQAWALENMVDKCEHPEWFEYSAPIESYDENIPSVHIDRAIKKSGETIEWEGYKLTIEWMPGQTEFALGVHGIIDGKTVLFTGDNIDGNPTDPVQNGHEAIVARNSGILEEGYIYGAEMMKRVNPDLILAGHSWAIADPAPLIERYRKWAYEVRDTFRSLSTDEDYRYWFDPFWVRAEPYRLKLKRGGSADLQLHVRNFRPREQNHRIEVHTLSGITSVPAVIEGNLPKETRDTFTVHLRADPNADPGVHIVAFDPSLDGQRYGELFDCIIEVE